MNDLLYESKLRYVEKLIRKAYELKNYPVQYVCRKDDTVIFYIPDVGEFTISKNNIEHYYKNIHKVFEDLSTALSVRVDKCRFTGKKCVGKNCFTCNMFQFSEEDIEDRKIENGARL